MKRPLKPTPKRIETTPTLWYTVLLWRHFVGLVVDQETDKPKPKDEQSIIAAVAGGCLANEIGLVIIVVILAPFAIALVAAAALDVVLLPYTITRVFVIQQA